MENRNQTKKTIQMELHPNEVELIRRIREQFRYGRIEVITKDGLPMAIERTVERYSLSVSQHTDII